jgi:hypothetical protein
MKRNRFQTVKFTDRPLERFDDGVDVSRFIRDGNNESKIVVKPIRCQVHHLIVLNCRHNIVDQQIALLCQKM